MLIRPYGDTFNDGSIQLSFTLPLDKSPKSAETARVFVLNLGFDSCEIVESKSMAKGFTMFIAYARTSHSIDPDTIEIEEASEKSMDFDEVNAYIRENIGHKITVVGACTGSDAHTVGIDAIINMKGYNHHYGLERYPMIEAINLGAQVPNEVLIEKALEAKANVLLVSQIVTQKEVHINNLTELIELLEAENLRKHFITIVGGPRISHKLALELGFDAGFGRGTYANDVATFFAQMLVNRFITT